MTDTISLHTEKLDQILDNVHRRWNSVGVSLTVVQQPKTGGEWAEYIGTRGKSSGDTDWREDTLSSIASVSKHFTTLALGTLIHDGHVLQNGEKLSWNTKVKDVLPGWKLQDPIAGDNCTLADLGAMRSGMPGHDQGFGDRSPEEILSVLHLFPPSAPFRETCQYFGAGYALLAHIIPTLTGQDFDTYLRERILSRIGMTDTAHPRNAALESDRYADQHVEEIDVKRMSAAWKDRDGDDVPSEMFGEKRKGFRWLTKGYNNFGPGAGHLISTPKDMGTWMKELLEPKVLAAETIAKITKPHSFWTSTGQPASPEEGIQAYGLGMIVYSYRGYTVWSHPGGVPGGASMMLLLPDEKIGVTVLINDGTWGPALIKVVTMQVVDQLLGLPTRDWEAKCIDGWAGWLGMIDPELKLDEKDKEPAEHIDIRGKYLNGAYGELDIRPVDDTPEVKAIMPKIRLANAVPIPDDSEVYVARSEKLFWGWMLFHKVGGGRWRYWSFQTYRPHDTEERAEQAETGETILYPWSGGVAVFSDKEGGVGMFGGITRAGAVDEHKEVVLEDLKNKAELWYARI